MALHTLKHLKTIHFTTVDRIKKHSMTKWPNEYIYSRQAFVNIDDDQDIISFKIQNGPLTEKGLNGCQVDEMIQAAYVMINGLNQEFPSEYNSIALHHLDEALGALRDRKSDRVNRGVEGQSKL